MPEGATGSPGAKLPGGERGTFPDGLGGALSKVSAVTSHPTHPKRAFMGYFHGLSGLRVWTRRGGRESGAGVRRTHQDGKYGYMTMLSIRGRVPIVLALLVPLLMSFAGAGASAAPGSGLIVVTANLQEAFDDRDVSDHSEMGVFVDRLLERVGVPPDVLLLQDVRKSAVRYVIDRLKNKTDATYAIGQALPALPGVKEDDKWISVETAVVFNTATMTMPARGGFTRVRNPWGVHVKYVEYKSQAFVGLNHKATGGELAFMSVHLPKPPRKSAQNSLKTKAWAEQLATFMKNRFETKTRIIGGDFNQTRCVEKDPECVESPYWTQLSGMGYIEAISTAQQRLHWTDRIQLGVDYIFTASDDASVVNGSGDVENPPDFYSDHRFFWAELSL